MHMLKCEIDNNKKCSAQPKKSIHLQHHPLSNPHPTPFPLKKKTKQTKQTSNHTKLNIQNKYKNKQLKNYKTNKNKQITKHSEMEELN